MTARALHHVRHSVKHTARRTADAGWQVGLLFLEAAALTAALIFACGVAAADEAPPAAGAASDPAAAKRTAVALNYCRSAFHRIRQNPTREVLADEQRKILNNLNLASIQDEEVVSLYSSVLDEIGAIHIAERERHVVDSGYGKSWQSLATFTAFGVMTDLTDMNYASLVKRGASSWWDLRGLQVSRDMELWKVEKARMTAIVGKSSSFLDASWKLARKRNIPDAWLVRNGDLDRLETAVREHDPEVRLRLLARMEPFMTCYPPYWYYVGRTQQAMGRFVAAEQTYQKLADIGEGHFRRDEMLAASLANVAAIRDFLKKPDAREAAEKALAYTTDSWEVNLTAATVLLRHGAVEAAEDAVLRNLDANLESEQSGVALLAVYAKQGDPKKILARLDDAGAVGRTPIPVLLRCAAALKGQTLPAPAAERLRSSLHGYFGRDDFVLVADPAWEFGHALFAVDEATFARPTLHATDRAVTVQFRKRTADSVRQEPDEYPVLLKYADDFQVKLTLRRDGTASVLPTPSFPRLGHLLSFASDRDEPPAPSRKALRIAAVETGGTLIALDGPPRPAGSAEATEGVAVTSTRFGPVPSAAVNGTATAEVVRLGTPESPAEVP
jgi:hypothetical protein